MSGHAVEPRHAIVLFADGVDQAPAIEGDIGNSHRNKDTIIKASAQCIRSGEQSLLALTPDGNHSTDDGRDATIEVLLEPVLCYARLLVIGNTAVARALPIVAASVGIDTLAVKTNDLGVLVEHNANAVNHIVWIQPRDSILVATHDNADQKALTLALQSSAGYVGVLGSQRKIAFLRNRLADVIPQARLASLHAPAGIDIGAIAPSEVALSIVAQIIQHRRRKR